VPVVLTTVGAGSILADPLFTELSDLFPGVTPIDDRTSTHAWSHPDVRAAVDKTGRKKLIMAGLVTEVCLVSRSSARSRTGSTCTSPVTAQAGSRHRDTRMPGADDSAGAVRSVGESSYRRMDTGLYGAGKTKLVDVYSRRGGASS
jgi:hypothetical protein